MDTLHWDPDSGSVIKHSIQNEQPTADTYNPDSEFKLEKCQPLGKI